MIEFIPATADYANDEASQVVWEWLKEHFEKDVDGIGYYKYPVVQAATGAIPELSLVTKTHQPIAVRCLNINLDEINSIELEVWEINGKKNDSPILELEDFIISLKSNFDRERILRKKIQPKAVLALPLINKTDFRKKFDKISFNDVIFIFSK